ncbi:MAG: spore maturation protein [Firmicutes bacterium]|nr:spore maturation protein [Bacillota bacterium]
MNYIWAGIIMVSFTYSCTAGNLENFGQALMSSSQNAVSFIINLAGIMAMWSGLMEIAERTGLINRLSSILMPFTKLLFPGQKDPETLSCIIMSFMSNIFGAGNSSTVFALRTMEKLDQQNHHNPVASNDMCTFAVVNMAFAPLIPVVTVQIREELGSEDPYSTILPAILVCICTLAVSIAACKYFERRKPH